jgi:hypothetical protein
MGDLSCYFYAKNTKQNTENTIFCGKLHSRFVEFEDLTAGTIKNSTSRDVIAYTASDFRFKE